MVANQKLQNALDEIKQICKMEAALYGTGGKLAAATEEACFSLDLPQVVTDFAESLADEQSYQEYRLYRIKVEGETEFILVCLESGEESHIYAQMAVCQIRNLVLSFTEHFDRNHFIQNVLLGNVLPADLISKAKKHHMPDNSRVVYVIDTGSKKNDVVLELVKNLSDIRSKDYVTSLDPHNVILVKDISHISGENQEEQLMSIAYSLSDNLHAEAMIKVRVAYGNVAGHLSDIAQSYQEARMALEVGRIFYPKYDTISYGKLGIGRLIYQLPMSLCEMFLKEVFGEKIPDILEDEEAMTTINKFLENNLNISETARQMYVHRNTLVYRLERIEKAIGLDIRTFDDAMTFKIAVMVIAHMKDSKRGEK